MTTTSGSPAAEIELKLEVGHGAFAALCRLPVLAGIAADDREQLATYYDTPDQTLSAAGISLRVRRTGERHVQTIKAGGAATAGMFARPEWEQDLAGPGPDVGESSPLRALVDGSVVARIRPAFSVAVRRRSWQVEWAGAAIELVADEGTANANGRQAPVAEIEAELKCGSPDALFSLARAIGQHIPVRLGVLTKAERGFRLAGGQLNEPAKAQRVLLDPGMDVAEAFAAIVGACLRQFRLNEEALRTNPGADALHQARVALRRLRSALSIFKPVIADDRFAHLADELRLLARSLGKARDLDVLVGRLGPNADVNIQAAHGQAYAAALATLDSQRTRDLMIDLIEWISLGAWRTHPADPGAITQPAREFAAAALKKLRGRLKKRGRQLGTLEDEDRHRVRIQAKKLRYAAEFFESLFTGKRARRRYAKFRKRLARLQEHLGELNDLATAPSLMKDLGLNHGSLPPDRRKALLAKATKAHAALMKAKRFW
ncbi:CHAD domain-containing protein [Sphingomonas sp. IC4-52]|uniref:CYTH and CHAD domain-containing protein n=1 Tax=Sphingomonas sp. IC4-52 TaxID=2887202 RepID=UPI001D12BCB3|nr:CHAD domain-containing protein [Sphingomonas sp. IC4-52]MCC2981530.1 CHAD domain-containing protein [Sphingomonas sp. IC4-52]